jgi:predicted DNA-binding transcriptional regulator YafY
MSNKEYKKLSSLDKGKRTCKIRPMLRRCRWLATMLRKDSKLDSTQKLGSRYEVSYKTIQRDIDLMRDFFLYPIVYDRSKHIWKLDGKLPEPML